MFCSFACTTATRLLQIQRSHQQALQLSNSFGKAVGMQVMQEVNGANPVSRSLFRTAFAQKRAALERGDASGGFTAPLWNALVFSKARRSHTPAAAMLPLKCTIHVHY